MSEAWARHGNGAEFRHDKLHLTLLGVHKGGEPPVDLLDRLCAMALAPRVGETFQGSVVEVDRKDPRRGTVMLQELAIEGPVSADAPMEAGRALPLRLAEADVEARRILFEPAMSG